MDTVITDWMMTMYDFGAWVEARLLASGSDVQALSVESGLVYAYLNRLFNSGKKGKPIRPDQKTVRQIGEGLLALGAIENQGEAEIAAGYIPDGYHILRDEELKAARLSQAPENWDDFPPELQDALGYVGALTPAAQRLVYQLWREQAHAHHDIEMRRREAERHLCEREELLRRLESGASA